MTALVYIAAVVFFVSTHVLLYTAGYRAGHDDTESAYVEALDWLAEQHKANDRRMRGA